MLDLDDFRVWSSCPKNQRQEALVGEFAVCFAIQCDSGLLHSPLVSCFVFELLLYVVSHRSSKKFPVAWGVRKQISEEGCDGL